MKMLKPVKIMGRTQVPALSWINLEKAFVIKKAISYVFKKIKIKRQMHRI